MTGNAQISEVWSLLFMHTGDPRYLNAALRMNDYLCACQDSQTEESGFCGVLPGSEPFGGDYQAYCCPSWSTKYFCDALMAERMAKARLEAGAATETANNQG